MNRRMRGLIHLFLWCAQMAVISVPAMSVGICSNSPLWTINLVLALAASIASFSIRDDKNSVGQSGF